MIFLELFWTFLKIGIFTFGGGYAMVALIQNEVVSVHGWMTAQEFTDVLAISQMTPGPLGINTATYAGYTAVANAGYAQPWAVGGALLASLAVLLLPVVLMMVVYRFLLRYQEDRRVQRVLKMVRLCVVGLIAAAALCLLTPETFGREPWQVGLSTAIFAGAFLTQIIPWNTERCRIKCPGPIAILLVAGLIGLLLM